MKHWQQHSVEERLQILDIVSDRKALPRLAVEKDWWVTMVLKALSMTEYAPLMSFKGGTSLSKGWELIERFSEDIDIALKRAGRFAINGFSNTQLASARRKARHYITKELPAELEEKLNDLGVGEFFVEPELSRSYNGEEHILRADTHPSVIYVNYVSIVPEASGYLQPRVKIEISCLSMEEPVQKKEINSFIGETMGDVEDVTVVFNTVIPTRTFLEKIFLLHEEFQKDKPRSIRMSRHLYDIEKIMHTSFADEALADRNLYDTIVTHRSIFNKIEGIEYETHKPETINFIPPASLIGEWGEDYKSLTNSFLYRKGNALSFDELIQQIERLIGRIRQL